MENEIVNQFLETMQSDPKAAELLQGYEAPADQDGEIRIYAEIATRMGYDINEGDLKAYLKKRAEIIKDRTEESATGIKELPDDVLEKVAGGKKDHSDCKYTYKDRENCWFKDGCDNIFQFYNKYKCHWDYWED